MIISTNQENLLLYYKNCGCLLKSLDLTNSQESEESEKMDEDSKIIEELRGINEQQKVQISRLEIALKQAISRQEEVKMSNNSELVKAKETIDELNRKLTSSFSTIDAKNMEVLNLQTALGQYYAEIEAKVKLFLISDRI